MSRSSGRAQHVLRAVHPRASGVLPPDVPSRLFQPLCAASPPRAPAPSSLSALLRLRLRPDVIARRGVKLHRHHLLHILPACRVVDHHQHVLYLRLLHSQHRDRLRLTYRLLLLLILPCRTCGFIRRHPRGTRRAALCGQAVPEPSAGQPRAAHNALSAGRTQGKHRGG